MPREKAGVQTPPSQREGAHFAGVTFPMMLSVHSSGVCPAEAQTLVAKL